MSLLREKLRRIRGRVGGATDSASSARTPVEDAGNRSADTNHQLPAIAADVPPTLRDPHLNQMLRDEGYVVIDLLAPDELDSLQDLRLSIHPGTGTGWESDFYTGSPTLKRRVHETLQRIFAPAIERHLVDHHTVLHNFIMNWPGDAGGLVLHQHSTVVDDERFRSVIVWCGVNEATEENGTLHVVPRSHRIQRGPRPERTSSWHDAHEDLLLENHLVSVPVGPGQAIVFDNQLLHCSFPNTTDAPRLSAAAIVIPNDAEFRYYAPTGGSRVRVHRADPQFFIDNQPGDFEWAEPDGLEFIEERSWTPTEIDADTLSILLGKGTCMHERQKANATGGEPR
jgi:hypothetical protein